MENVRDQEARKKKTGVLSLEQLNLLVCNQR